MSRRGIPQEMVEEVLNAPGQVMPVHGVVMAYQSKVEFPGGKHYLLRVMVNDQTVPTVYRTSKIDKYWMK